MNIKKDLVFWVILILASISSQLNATSCVDHFGNIPWGLEIDEQNPNTIFVGGRGILRSKNNGASWELMESTVQPNSGIATDIAINGSAVFVNWLYQGVFRSLDSGDTWQKVLDTFTPSKISINTIQSNIIYIVDSYNGVFKSIDNGSNWTNILTHAQVVGFGTDVTDGISIVSSALNDTIIVATAYPAKLLKSIDSGVNWTDITGANNFGTYFTFIKHHSQSSNLIFGSTDLGLFRSIDGGSTWALVSSDLIYTKELFEVSSNVNTLYFHHPHKIMKTTDGGLTFVQLPDPFSSSPVINSDIYYKSTFHVSPSSDTLIIGMEPNNIPPPDGYCKQLWRSLDDGTTWENISKIQVEPPLFQNGFE